MLTGLFAGSGPRYRVALAETPADLDRARALRALAFRAGAAEDGDAFDRLCRHVLIEDIASGTLVATLRLMPIARGAEIGQSYSAQFYELAGLSRFDGPMIEMGRFCLHPDWHDPDILRLAWAAVTRQVEATGAGMLFGCSSFHGTEVGDYLDAFALLRARHLGPRRWLPRVKAPRVFRFARVLRSRRPDLRQAMLRMPPLLRSYLAMGGWVSDHAVIDADLGTLHVFTGLEAGRIPPARARRLRASSG